MYIYLEIQIFDQQTAELMIDQMHDSLQEEAQNTYNRIIEYGIQQGYEVGMEKGMEKGMQKGIEQGIEKGMEKGKLEKATTTIKNLYSRGFQAQDISEIVNMKQVEVEKIIREIKLSV